mmetsp:Transcript_7292/g.10259  ORF Transcript_7292/g.10259 Transcript_7292/m.10259 type:complete len:249 (+) Transcript_7292:849-1595(+)
MLCAQTLKRIPQLRLSCSFSLSPLFSPVSPCSKAKAARDFFLLPIDERVPLRPALQILSMVALRSSTSSSDLPRRTVSRNPAPSLKKFVILLRRVILSRFWFLSWAAAFKALRSLSSDHVSSRSSSSVVIWDADFLSFKFFSSNWVGGFVTFKVAILAGLLEGAVSIFGDVSISVGDAMLGMVTLPYLLDGGAFVSDRIFEPFLPPFLGDKIPFLKAVARPRNIPNNDDVFLCFGEEYPSRPLSDLGF